MNYITKRGAKMQQLHETTAAQIDRLLGVSLPWVRSGVVCELPIGVDLEIRRLVVRYYDLRDSISMFMSPEAMTAGQSKMAAFEWYIGFDQTIAESIRQKLLVHLNGFKAEQRAQEIK
jgi:hypothetical protein